MATFSGGTIVANTFPAITYATLPNMYGTAGTADCCGYSETLTITVDPTFAATEISFLILNGFDVQSYVATAYDGANQVAQQTFALAPSHKPSYAVADLTASGITSATITPLGSPVNFDFFIDTVAFNESITAAVVPESCSLLRW